MKQLGRLWRGELPLENAFWNWAVLGGLIVNVASSVLFLFLIMAELLIAAFLVGYGLSLPYNIIATVGVWRSAGRYEGERRWADIARMVTLVGMTLLSIT